MIDFNRLYDEYLREFNDYAEAYATKLKTKPNILAESMKVQKHPANLLKK